MSNKNEGIIVSGSAQLHAGAVAAGRDATAINQSTSDPDVAEVRALVAELLVGLRAQNTQSSDVAAALPIAEALAQEVNSEQPRKFETKRLIAALATGVGLTSGLLTIVEQLQHWAGLPA